MADVAVLGHVQFDGVLGEGAFAKVYGGVTASKQQVAVKVPNDARHRSRIATNHEVQVLSKLSHHPNIISFLGICYYHGNVAVVFERISNIPLYEGASRLQHYSEAVVKVIAKQLLSALSFCHRKRIVHRDVTSDNILWVSSPERLMVDEGTPLVKLIDFNIAKVMPDQSCACAGLPLGNVLFMSPEAMLDESVISPATDVWSLGVVLFNLLMGHPPFWNDNYIELLSDIEEVNLAMDRQHWKEVSPAGRAIVKKMITRRREDRPSSDELTSDRWLRSTVAAPHQRSAWKATQLKLKLFYAYHRGQSPGRGRGNRDRRGFKPTREFDDFVAAFARTDGS